MLFYKSISVSPNLHPGWAISAPISAHYFTKLAKKATLATDIKCPKCAVTSLPLKMLYQKNTKDCAGKMVAFRNEEDELAKREKECNSNCRWDQEFARKLQEEKQLVRQVEANLRKEEYQRRFLRPGKDAGTEQ